MSNVHYSLQPVLSQDQLEMIVSDGIRILDEIGVECKHSGIQGLVAKTPGGRVRGERLHFEPKLCREHIEKIRQKVRGRIDPAREHTQKSQTVVQPPSPGQPSPGLPSPGPSGHPLPQGERVKLKAVGPWTCINVIDMDSQKMRLGTLADMIDATKLLTALNIEGRKICAPICPNDIPGRLQSLTMAKESWKFTDQTGGGVSSTVREIEALYELGTLAGVKPPYTFIEFGISPLTFNPDTLDLVYKMLGRPEMAAMAIDPGPIPTLGGTGPLSFKAVLAQSVAETLGGSVLVDILTAGERTPLCSAMTAVGVDMRFGTVNFSSPESILLLNMGFEVGSYVTGVRSMGGAMRTIAKWHDEQAASEKTMCALMGALAGARHFCDLGQISVDDAFSFEQVVLDMEILAGVERFMNGFDFDNGADTLTAIREGLETRNFFTSDLTMANFRKDYWCPKIFERRMLGSWQAAGAPTVLDKARQIAKEKIASVQPRLDEGTARKMDDLVKKFAATV